MSWRVGNKSFVISWQISNDIYSSSSQSPPVHRVINAKIMAQIPSWLNRENIQITLIVLVTMMIHYYFIHSRLQAKVDETLAEMEAEEAANSKVE